LTKNSESSLNRQEHDSRITQGSEAFSNPLSISVLSSLAEQPLRKLSKGDKKNKILQQDLEIEKKGGILASDGSIGRANFGPFCRS
jgi:hypothetical protein